jgi:DNA-binding Lrp family transcriptional regulator
MTGLELFSDADVLSVLRTLYRVRSATVAEFEELESIPRARLDEILRTLEAAGYINRDGERINPVSPDAAVASILRRSVGEQQATLAAAAALLETLPTITRDWELGEADAEYSLTAEIIHGHQAQWEAWGRYALQWPPNRPICLYPDLSILRELIAPDVANVRAETGVDTPLRAILPAAVCADPASQPTLQLLIAGGMEIRTLGRVPNWIYVDDGIYASVPVNWAEHPPNSILIIRHPTVVSALAYVAETQWSLAVPFTTDADGWEPVLRLLAQGLPDRAIATALGTSMRTVQRRITDAMEDLGATSRFELGFAYSRWGSAAAE